MPATGPPYYNYTSKWKRKHLPHGVEFFWRRKDEDIDCCTATDEAARPGMLSPELKNIT